MDRKVGAIRTGLRDVDHVRHQCKSVQLELRDVCLQQNVDLVEMRGDQPFDVETNLRRGLVNVLLDGDGHTLGKLCKLKLLLVTDTQVLNMMSRGKK